MLMVVFSLGKVSATVLELKEGTIARFSRSDIPAVYAGYWVGMVASGFLDLHLP